jgi:ribonucleoside-diphosphate reductase alpha chain
MDIPQSIKNIYKTAFEIKQKKLIDMFIERQAFIDQSQSMNIFFDNPKTAQEATLEQKVSSSLEYAHKNNLKTGIYYLRQKPVVNRIKLQYEMPTEIEEEEPVCKMCQ